MNLEAVFGFGSSDGAVDGEIRVMLEQILVAAFSNRQYACQSGSNRH